MAGRCGRARCSTAFSTCWPPRPVTSGLGTSTRACTATTRSPITGSCGSPPGLDPDWTYPFDTDAGPVDDCYALNVDGEAAWAYYYSSFPIVRITDGSVTAWRTEVAGAAGLLAAAGACALVGGYGVADSDRLVVGQLTDRRYEIIDELRLTLPGGQPMPTASFICRGPDLHVFIGRSWYRLALDDIV